MTQARTLIFTTCYNERENIGPLIDAIFANSPTSDLLVVDDDSPDGTWRVIQQKKAEHPNLYAVKRPGKLGIGSAHKYAIYYAMREGYETLLTMDADFSHDPKLIPNLIAAHGKNTFVTGSRYCEGGSSDYSGYRDLVSRIGNKLARFVLGVRIRELTTYFRVFDVERLKQLPLRRVSASGYSYGVELVYHLRKAGVELREVPIHFSDRTRGESKIPRLQILISALDLFGLGFRRFGILRDLKPDQFIWDACAACGDRVLAMKHFGSRTASKSERDIREGAEYRCTSVGSSDYPPVFTCLCCGLEQVPSSFVPASLESTYSDVVDPKYLENRKAREKTYRTSFDKLSEHLPSGVGSLLEVGAYCGLYLKEAKRRGWKAEGIEPSSWASAYARDVTGVNVREGFMSKNSSTPHGCFDVVVSWDVLEHVRNPVEFLKQCGSYLKPDGVLALSTLDVDTWFPRLFGKRWPWLMNMHLFYFSKSTVRTVLESAGFELVHASRYTHYARVRYAANGMLRVLPAFLCKPASWLTRLIPDSLVVPFSFGDIKLYVARKHANESDAGTV